MRSAVFERFLAERGNGPDDDATRALFEQRYPPGYFGHAPGGEN